MTRALLRRSQIAPEATVGTAVEGTHQLHGALTLKNAPERVRREERRASMGGSNTWVDMAYRSEGQYTGRVVTQELPFFLVSSIRGDVTPSTPSGAVKLWTFTSPTTTIPALKSLTAYVGNDTEQLRAAGVFTRQLTIEGRDTGSWMLTADLFGRELVHDNFADPVLTTMAGDTIRNIKTLIYINDSSADFTATPILNTLYGIRWIWTSGIEPDYTMNGGTLDMTDIQRDEPECTLEITAKFAASIMSSTGEYADYRGTDGIPVTRFVRIYNEGSTISTTYEHSVTIDGAYKITDFTPLAEERNGTLIATMQLTAVEDTWGKIQVAVQNTLTAAELPVA
jgi:hypothetical protein